MEKKRIALRLVLPPSSENVNFFFVLDSRVLFVDGDVRTHVPVYTIQYWPVPFRDGGFSVIDLRRIFDRRVRRSYNFLFAVIRGRFLFTISCTRVLLYKSPGGSLRPAVPGPKRAEIDQRLCEIYIGYTPADNGLKRVKAAR